MVGNARKTGLVLCCLALMVQAIFAGAIGVRFAPVEMKCASGSGFGQKCKCGASNEHHGCCKNSSTKSFRDASQCSCELKQVPVSSRTSIALPQTPVNIAAIVPVKPVFIAPALTFAEPGIVGIDSGPPLPVARVPDLGRAPPVA